MATKSRNHDESRGAVCLACLNKTNKGRKILSHQVKIIQNFIPKYNLEDRKFPTVFCPSCFIKISMNQAVDFVDYSSLDTKPRDNQKCYCVICSIARAHRYDYKKLNYSIERQPKPGVQPSNVPKTQKVCTRCFQKVGRGIVHKCTIRNKIQNTVQAAGEQRQQVASSILDTQLRQSKESSSIKLKRARGHSLEIQKVTKKTKMNSEDTRMTGEDLKDIQATTKSSFQVVRKITAKWRRKNKKSVKWGAVSECERISHKLDDSFSVT